MKKIAMTGAMMLAAGGVFAADCTLALQADDMMQFQKLDTAEQVTEVVVDKAACPVFTVTLQNKGMAMPHNFVVTKDADAEAVNGDAAATMGVPADDDARILGMTAMANPSETVEVKFDTSKMTAEEAYKFFCSYLGHFYSMQGKFIVK